MRIYDQQIVIYKALNGQCFIFKYENRIDVVRKVGQYAAACWNGFTWVDAAKVNKKTAEMEVERLLSIPRVKEGAL